MDEPLAVMVAPTGARRTKQDHPAIPITPDEVAVAASACVDAGAALIHVHVRDRSGQHLLDADAYRATINRIRSAVGDRMIIQVSTEAVGRYGREEQMALVRDLVPEAISFAVRELFPADAEEGPAAAFLEWVDREAILPQYILYSRSDVERFHELCRRGVIPSARLAVIFVLGRYGAIEQSGPIDLVPFLGAWKGPGSWSMCAFGPREGACALTAAALGGHVRVGLENNLYLTNGTQAPDNAALVRQVTDHAALVGRRIVRADEARAVLWNPPDRPDATLGR
jgi:uncharacterized protein (DUF849 family)